MLCVTMSVVRWFSSTISSVRLSTLEAVLGSRAAVCSSSSSRRGLVSVAISRVSAWRWPPESRPTLALRRVSRPRSRRLSSSTYSSFSALVTPHERPRRWPRRLARARFSAICMSAAVPRMGSWNTRPRYLARCDSLRREMSVPSSSITPESSGYTPAIILSSVDLPAPLPPITVTKSPSLRVRSTPVSARFSVTVPLLKVFLTCESLSICLISLRVGAAELIALPNHGHAQGHGDDHGGE